MDGQTKERVSRRQKRLRDRGDRETTETERSRGQQSIASSLWSHGLLGPMVPKKLFYHYDVVRRFPRFARNERCSGDDKTTTNGRTDKTTNRSFEVRVCLSACLLVCSSACLLAHANASFLGRRPCSFVLFYRKNERTTNFHPSPRGCQRVAT